MSGGSHRSAQASRADHHGYMIVVELGDSVEAIERESGCAVLTSASGDARFGDPEFTPAAEVIEEQEACFELVFVFTDDGYGVEIFVPKVEDTDPNCSLALSTTREVQGTTNGSSKVAG